MPESHTEKMTALPSPLLGVRGRAMCITGFTLWSTVQHSAITQRYLGPHSISLQNLNVSIWTVWFLMC